MSAHEMNAALLSELQDLAPLTPDPARAARLRARCQAQLRSRASRPALTTPAPRFAGQRFVSVVVLTACALYVVSLVRAALHLQAAF